MIKIKFRYLPLIMLIVSSLTHLNVKALTFEGIFDKETKELLLADPTIIKIDGKYYMAGTQSLNPPGFTILESEDLRKWIPCSLDFSQIQAGNRIYGTKNFWAPQFVEKDGKIYAFYTANEQVASASANSINEIFSSPTSQAIDESEHNIDPFLFEDTDGKYYLYHVRFDNGNYLWVGEYDFNTGKIIDGTLKPVFRCDQAWENTNAFESVPIMEGPTVIKLEDTYYLFYSANHFMSKDYAVGYATAPTPLGPWTKNPDNPIIHRSIIAESGTGHGDIFYDNDGKMRYVFHTHNSEDKVSPRRTRIITLNSVTDPTSGVPYKIVADSLSLIKPIIDFSALSENYYCNPVIDRSAPDPTVIRTSDGSYYLYATENERNVPIYKSDDLVDWKLVGTAFTEESRPKMVPDGNIWAPDIQYLNGRYVMYYSKSRWGGEWECGIGVATADSPEGPFTDHGPLFISSEIGVQNSIDPIFVTDKGKNYLFWGSFRGIYAIELAKDGLSVKRGAKPIQIAGTLTEGTNIFKHDGYYYLIGSAGSCCDGERSTYRIVMARSKNLLGPYYNKEGVAAIDNGFTLMLSRSKEVIGPGHNANFVTDDAGEHWMLYHGFDADEPEAGRKVYLDRIVWDPDGWPAVEGARPSVMERKPYIIK